MSQTRAVTYDRPMEAKVLVRLANGEEWDAKAEDLRKFGYLPTLDTYMVFNDTLTKVLTEAGLLNHDHPERADDYREITDAELNPLRYLVETVLCYPDLIDHRDHAGWRDIADLERALRGVDEVRDLHAKRDCLCDHPDPSERQHVSCSECGSHWPCATIRAVGVLPEDIAATSVD